jgi:hypothetical protein
MGKKSRSGFGLNNRIIFWVKKIRCGSGIQDEKNSDPGWKKFGSGINIPNPQH